MTGESEFKRGDLKVTRRREDLVTICADVGVKYPGRLPERLQTEHVLTPWHAGGREPVSPAETNPVPQSCAHYFRALTASWC